MTLKELYDKKINIMEYLRDNQRKTNDYALEEIDNVEYHNLWYEAAANIFDSLDYNSILDAGTGEATTLHGIMKNSKENTTTNLWG